MVLLGQEDAREPSIFWEEALATGLVRLTGDAPCPEENPHPEGSGVADRARAVVPLTSPDPAEIARIEPVLERLEQVQRARPKAARWRCPSVISVTALLTFLRDEEEFYWRYVRRVPMPPSPAAQLGIELHRRIEEHARGGVALSTPPEDEEPYDLDVGERRGDGGGVSAEQMWQNFLSEPLREDDAADDGAAVHALPRRGPVSRGPDRRDLRARGRHRGRSSTTRRAQASPDPLQLAIYARAVSEIWNHDAQAHWLLLREGREREPDPSIDLESILIASGPRLRSFG